MVLLKRRAVLLLDFECQLGGGGFKFQVQRVNDAAPASTPPGAWQRSGTFSGADSADGHWRSAHAGDSERSVPFGKYWRSHPVVCSLVPRCQGLYGSAKRIWIASRWAKRSCSAISLPRSTGSVLRSGAGTGRSFSCSSLGHSPHLSPPCGPG
jgi:hypothetical protein